MFDFDAGKLMIIATVALVVIGPKDLPRVLRQMGQMVNKLRRMANEFQGQFMDAMKEADLQDIRAEVAKLKDSATLDVSFDPVHEVKTHLDQAMAVGGPAMTAIGSTSEITQANIPASSSIEPEAAAIASSGFGPAVEIAALPEPAHAGDMHAGDMAAAAVDEPSAIPVAADAVSTQDPPARRKTVLVRRRIGPRQDTVAKPPAWPRSRNILPARRETPDQ